MTLSSSASRVHQDSSTSQVGPRLIFQLFQLATVMLEWRSDLQFDVTLVFGFQSFFELKVRPTLAKGDVFSLQRVLRHLFDRSRCSA